MFLGLLLIIVVLYFIFNNKTDINKFGKTPMNILKKRYANGEISKTEFDEMKKNLLS